MYAFSELNNIYCCMRRRKGGEKKKTLKNFAGNMAIKLVRQE